MYHIGSEVAFVYHRRSEVSSCIIYRVRLLLCII